MTNPAIDDMKRATGPYFGNRRVDEIGDEELVELIESFRCTAIDEYIGWYHDHINYAWKRKEIARVFEEQFGLDPASVEDAAVRELQKQSPEGWGDAAVRLVQGQDPEKFVGYRVLWNEFVRRAMLHTMQEPSVDGGWSD